jgi:phosphoenolpyruvate-protein phosphotransferase/dihydroxyacetone kinase phosphotransfer subunit
MVSIVIVSHSAKLAEGARDLAEQMVKGQVPLAVAGGTNDPENPIGTDPVKVHAAIESVYSPDGVLVLMDLGSALLSADMALEFLSSEQRDNVYLCSAPLVEGTMAAAVQASVGGNIHQVLKEARGALAAKISQLEPTESQDATPLIPTLPLGDSQTLLLTVQNKMGLHARPAANFVKTTSPYRAEVWVSKGSKRASAKSINQVATLGVRRGDQILVTAVGPDASEALAALQILADHNFGWPDEADEMQGARPMPPVQPIAEPPDELVGIPASPGVAIGPVFQYKPRLPEIEVQKVADAAAEWARLEAVIAATLQDIKALHAEAARQVGANEAAIFEVHSLFLQDPALLEAAKARIFEAQLNAEAAWQEAVETIANDYRTLDDEYLRGRVADVLDVGQRVLMQLMQVELPSLDLGQPSILVAPELTPSDIVRLDPADVLGICTEMGGETSHSAILARALGIPAISGLNRVIRYLPDGQVVAIDGSTGRLCLHPDAAKLTALEAQRSKWQQEQQQAKVTGQKPAVTQDGQTVEVVANIGGPNDAEIALEFGAEGVGLFRTELLFMDRKRAPTEDEQLATYRRVTKTMETRPLIIRTLDVGGDKPLPYLDPGAETNPFLGWRGIRFCLDHPEIFKPQLRAILRASPGHNIKLMFPMISTLPELRAAKEILAEAQEELRAANVGFDEDVEVGVMIEVPAAVAVADQLATEADFFSIGSNDLAQYVMAADRGNGQVSALANALQPAVLRLIQETVQAAHAAGIRAGICGELAGNALAAPLLVGLGLDELSMSAPNIPAVKAVIRHLTLEQAQRVAREALALESAEAVQDYLEQSELG